MFKSLMAVQWKWTRGAVLLGTILGFAVPVLSLSVSGLGAADIIRDMQSYSVMYAALAAGVGLAVALLAWSADHKGRHVYALSLPISRGKYAGMRFLSGLFFICLPALGVLAGCLLASVVLPIPPGLHAYPFALSLRFFCASCVAFAIFFAIGSTTPRAAGVVLGSLALVVAAQMLLTAAHFNFAVIDPVIDLIFSSPGILSVFTGRWMLIDV